MDRSSAVLKQFVACLDVFDFMLACELERSDGKTLGDET